MADRTAAVEVLIKSRKSCACFVARSLGSYGVRSASMVTRPCDRFMLWEEGEHAEIEARPGLRALVCNAVEMHGAGFYQAVLARTR